MLNELLPWRVQQREIEYQRRVIQELQAQVTALQAEGTSERVKAVEAQVTALQAEGTSERVKAVEAQVSGLRTALEAQFAEAQVALHVQLAQVHDELGQVHDRVAQIQGQVVQAHDQVAHLQARLAELQGQIAEARLEATNSWDRFHAELDRLRRSADAWQRELMLLVARIHALESAPPPAAERAEPSSDPLLTVQLLQALIRPEERIAQLQARLLAHLPAAGQVIALGAGSGDFLRAAAAAGLAVRAVEPDPVLARHCQAQGFEVAGGEPLDFLASLAAASLDGVVSTDLPEQLSDAALYGLLVEVHRALRDGGHLVMAPHDPRSLAALRELLSLGGLPRRLLHPDRARALLLAAGFHAVSVEWPEHRRARAPDAEPPGDDEDAQYVIVARRTSRSFLRDAVAPQVPASR